MTITWKFEPCDLWIGVYYKGEPFTDIMNGVKWTAYVCIVPMLPIIISWRTYD